MSKAMFARVQLLLEETQEKIRVSEEKWQNSERQILGLTQKVQELERQIALFRAQAMQAVELARRGE
jgi:hypothetical protein